jgi:long-subunit fatty acid transport protein
MAQVVRELIGIGLILSAGALPVAAQSMALSAADPVGIARSGAQVAYGYSLEAAATNPALLASLKENREAYLSAGMEIMSIQQTLESTQQSLFSFNRNRSVGALGLAMRVTSVLTLGLKLDEPYSRHGSLLDDAATRYLGDGIDLSAKRMEAQAAWALNPNLSIGIGVGAARLVYGSTSVMRFNVPVENPALPISAANPVDGLVEQRVGEDANKVVPSYSLGLRWAINPRWTLGMTYQSGLKADLAMKAGFRDANLGIFANDGLSTPPIGADVRAAALLAASNPVVAGSQTLELPSQTKIGIRHRIMPFMTWEADLRWTSAGLRVPSFAAVQTPSGTVSAPWELPHGKSHMGLDASSELELGKFWTLRAGLSLDQRSVDASVTEPLLGGAPTSAFSIGAGYRIWGGQLNFGYQIRLSQDQDSTRLAGVWSSAGYRSVGTKIRIEGEGHLVALGYKMTF